MSLLTPHITCSITLTTQTQEGRRSLSRIADTDTEQDGGKYLIAKLSAEWTSGHVPLLKVAMESAFIYFHILEDRSEGR